MNNNETVATAPTTAILDTINTLLHFDRTGDDCELAMSLMIKYSVGSDELNARWMDADRPTYRPTTEALRIAVRRCA